jgi:Uroporphyrinogen decarboxylase (URO-D)
VTSRERLVRTFRGEKTDRMPVSPFLWYNNMFEMFGYTPHIDHSYLPQDFDIISKWVEYCDTFGFDVLFAGGFLFDCFVPGSADNWDVTITKEGDADSQKRTTIVRTPEGELRQVMNLRRSEPHLIVLAVEKYIIEERRDFDLFRKFAPPAQYVDLGVITRARSIVGDKGLVNLATFGTFNTLNMFRKLETMMMDPYTDEGFYREMMGFFADWNNELLNEVIAAGADSIELGGNLATSGAGPEFFKTFVMEYENTLARQVHRNGAFVVYHNCGDAQKIMHLYNDLDIDCWGYLTGQPFGDVVLEDALRTIRPNMALRGNIDQVEFMKKATPEEVRNRVRALIEKVKPRGNWILSTTDFFFDGTSYDNIHAFARAGMDFGVY